jgi:hypothetical protein
MGTPLAASLLGINDTAEMNVTTNSGFTTTQFITKLTTRAIIFQKLSESHPAGQAQFDALMNQIVHLKMQNWIVGRPGPNFEVMRHT